MKTFIEQYNKLTEEYIANRIEPFNGSFCFCGNLNKNNPNWRWGTFEYKSDDLIKMESLLIKTIVEETITYEEVICSFNNIPSDEYGDREAILTHPNYENALFNGFSKALDYLKEVHKAKGENVEEQLVPEFKKRQLV